MSDTPTPPRTLMACTNLATPDWSRPPRTRQEMAALADSPVWGMTFPKAYHVMRNMGNMLPGPMDIRDAAMWPLLLLRMTLPHVPVPWLEIAKAWKHPGPMVFCAEAAALVKGPVRLQRLRCNLDAGL